MRSQLLHQSGSTAAVCAAAAELRGALQQAVSGVFLRSVHDHAQDAPNQASSHTVTDGPSTVDAAGAVGADGAADAADAASVPNVLDSSSNGSSTTSSSSRNRGGKFDRWPAGAEESRSSQQLLESMGLWVPRDMFASMTPQQQNRISRQRNLALLLEQRPSACMSAVSLNLLQLQVVVSPIDQRPPKESSRKDASDKAAQVPRAYSTHTSDAAAPAEAAAGAHKPQQKRQQKQQQQQQQKQPQVQRVSLDFDQQLLGPESLMRLNESSLLVNLNSQMRAAFVSGQQAEVVALFDSVLEQGIAAAQQQQQQSGAQPERLTLPQQYRPDHSALMTYCKCLDRLADRAIGRFSSRSKFTPAQLLARAQQAAALWGSDNNDAERLAALTSLVHTALLAAYRAAGQLDQAVAHFQAVREELHPSVLQRNWKMCYHAAAAAAGLGDVQLADEVGRMFTSDLLTYTAEDYRARIGPLFNKLAGVAAQKHAWEAAIYWLQQLINKDALVSVHPSSFLVVLQSAAAAGRMDYARVMMQALDDQLKLQGQEPYTYSEYQILDLLEAAGKAGDVPFIEQLWKRLVADLRRTEDRGSRILSTINNAAAGGSSTDASSSQDTAAAAAGSSGEEHPVMDILAAAGEADASSSSSSSTSSKRPSSAAHLAVIRAFVTCEQYGKALDHVAELEAAFAGRPECSVYEGLRFFPESLRTEAQVVTAFTQLQARKAAGSAASTTMLNIICRAVARLGNTEATGQVFESYGSVWGLSPDADSYNTVMESCEAAKKVAAVEGLISYMASKDCPPNSTSWNLLLSTAIRAGDSAATTSVLNRMRSTGVKPAVALLHRAIGVAHGHRDFRLQQVLQHTVTDMNLPSDHRLVRLLRDLARDLGRSRMQQFSSSSSRGSNNAWPDDTDGSSGGEPLQTRADVWKPRTQRQQQQQEQHQHERQDRVQGRREDRWRSVSGLLAREDTGNGSSSSSKSSGGGSRDSDDSKGANSSSSRMAGLKAVLMGSVAAS